MLGGALFSVVGNSCMASLYPLAEGETSQPELQLFDRRQFAIASGDIDLKGLAAAAGVVDHCATIAGFGGHALKAKAGNNGGTFFASYDAGFLTGHWLGRCHSG